MPSAHSAHQAGARGERTTHWGFHLRSLLLGHNRLAVAPGGDAEDPYESTPHQIDTAEARGKGNGLHAPVRQLKLTPRRFDTRLKDVSRRRLPDFAGESPLEVAAAHGNAIRQHANRQLAVNVFSDPHLKLLNRSRLSCLRRQRNTQLTLPRRAAEKEHELARRFVGETAAVVLLDPSQSEVYARRNTRRGIEIAIPYPQRVALHADTRVAFRQLSAVLPVRRGAPSAQQPCFGQQKCTHANGAHATNRRCCLAQPGRELRILRIATRGT